MKKIIWIPIVIIIVGVVIAILSYTTVGAVNGFWLARNGIEITNRGKLVSVDESYQSFNNIKVDAAYFDRITLKEGEAYAVRGSNYENWGGIDVKLDGDTLHVDSRVHNVRFGINNLFGRGRININFGNLNFGRNNNWLEITYPSGAELGEVQVNVSAGDIRIEGLTANTIDISNEFGKVDVSEAEADSISLKLSAGDLGGDDIKADDLTVDNSLGKTSFERLHFSGRCKIDSSAGDVSLGLLMAENDLSYSLSTSLGSIWVGDSKSAGSTSVRSNTDASASLDADVSLGSIRVRFDR
ncbi:MAG: DUF4097 domain-containing protein [Clostridiales bacterium]|nr:DUF4097 domain-containing protein [Clostridiales bacterium]